MAHEQCTSHWLAEYTGAHRIYGGPVGKVTGYRNISLIITCEDGTDMNRINEGSTCALQLTWLRPDRSMAVPDSVRYRIDCNTTGQPVRAPTDLAPGADLFLTPSDTAILGDGQAEQERYITIVAQFPGGWQATCQEKLMVRNLKFYPL